MIFKTIALATLLLGLPAQEQTFDFKTKQIVGRETVVSNILSIESSQVNVEIKVENKTKVLTVESDGAYSVELTVLGGSQTANGQTSEIPAQEARTFKYDKDGEMVVSENDPPLPANPFTALGELLTKIEPKAPVKIGDSWESKSKYGKFTVKLVGKEKHRKVDCLKLTVSGEIAKDDLSGKADATMWLLEKDYTLVEAEASAKEANLIPGLQAANFGMKLIAKPYVDQN